MALRSTKDRVALLKIESTYGDDAGPLAAQAILLMNSSISPLSDKLERQTDRPFFGGDPFVLINERIELEAECDLIGSATPGTAAPLGALYRTCGHSETLVAVAVAAPGTLTPSTSTSGGTLAAATYYYVMTAINAVGETIASAEASQATTGASSTVTLAWSAVSGATGYKLYRATATGNETYLTTLGAVTTYTDTGAITPGTAVPPVANTTVGAAYRPISSNFASAMVYFYQSGILFAMTGVRGYIDFNLSINSYAKGKIKLTGLLTQPADGEAPAGIDFTAFQTPAAIQTETWEVVCGGVNVCAKALTLSCNSDVKIQECSEAREVTIADRKPTGTLRVLKDSDLATWDPFAIAKQQQVVTLISRITKSSGLNVDIPIRAQLEYPKPTDIDGVMGYEINFTAVPSGAGGDEYALIVR